MLDKLSNALILLNF